jgi:hypothetical protein
MVAFGTGTGTTRMDRWRTESRLLTDFPSEQLRDGVHVHLQSVGTVVEAAKERAITLLHSACWWPCLVDKCAGWRSLVSANGRT